MLLSHEYLRYLSWQPLLLLICFGGRHKKLQKNADSMPTKVAQQIILTLFASPPVFSMAKDRSARSPSDSKHDKAGLNTNSLCNFHITILYASPFPLNSSVARCIRDGCTQYGIELLTNIRPRKDLDILWFWRLLIHHIFDERRHTQNV